MAFLELGGVTKVTRIKGVEYIVLTNTEIGDGLFPLQTLKEQLVVQSSSSFNGEARPESEAPTIDGFWLVTEAGIYKNFGGVELPASSIGFIIKKEGVFTITYTGIEGDAFLRKDEKVPNENLTFGEVKEGDENVVSGGEVFNDKTNTVDSSNSKNVDSLAVINNTKNIIQNQSENLFKQSDAVYNMYIQTNGVLSPTNTDNRVTGKIKITDGFKKVFLYGLKKGYNKRLVCYNASGLKVGAERNFTETPVTLDLIDGADHFRVWYKEGSDTDIGNNLGIYFKEQRVTDIFGINIYSDDKTSTVDSSLNDSRYNELVEIQKKVYELEKQKETVKSLVSLKGVNSERVGIKISNTQGKDLQDVIVPFFVKWGNVKGKQIPNNAYLNKKGRKDLKDLRFTDSNGNKIEAELVDSGNYEFVYIDKPMKNWIVQRFDGALFGSDGFTEGVYLSIDNMESWSLVKSNSVVVGCNKLGDLLYARGKDLFISTKTSNYSDEKKVLTGDYADSIWRFQNFKMDDQNNIYLGTYQESEFGVTVYKSTDNGNTFNSIYTSTSQHVHNITLDRGIIPNVIYVSQDGVEHGTGNDRTRTVKSTDRGVNFTEIYEIGKSPDDGVVFAENGVCISAGEGEIKGFPTIQRSSDFGETWEIILRNSQNMMGVNKIGNNLFASNIARGVNKYVFLYRSEDMGKTWRLSSNLGIVDVNYNGAGYRYGAKESVKPIGDVEQLILSADSALSSKIPPMRVYAGEENYQAMFYLRLKNLPNAGIHAFIETDYLVQDIEPVNFKDYMPNGLIARLPLNDFKNEIKETVNNVFSDTNSSNWDNSVTNRYAFLVPFKNKPITGAIMDVSNPIILDKSIYKLNRNKNITFNFWYKRAYMPTWEGTSNKLIFGYTDNSLSIFRRDDSQLIVQISGINNSISQVFPKVFWENYQMVTIVITNDTTPRIIVYINGVQFSNIEARSFKDNESIRDMMIGGYVPYSDYYKKDDATLTDVSIFSRVLSSDEVLRMFQGGNLIQGY